MSEEQLGMDFESAMPKVDDTISTIDLDNALTEVKSAQADYDAKKEISNEAHAVMEAAKARLVTLLESAGKKRWEVDGIGGFTVSTSLKFRVPADVNSKAKFFEFIESPVVSQLLGQNSRDIFLAYATVHHASLNSLCNNLTELAAARGDMLEIPGIGQPTSEVSLRALPQRNN